MNFIATDNYLSVSKQKTQFVFILFYLKTIYLKIISAIAKWRALGKLFLLWPKCLYNKQLHEK